MVSFTVRLSALKTGSRLTDVSAILTFSKRK